MDREILKYYLSNRPLFLALIRGLEIPLYQHYACLRGQVLDYGCGDGFFLHVLRRYAPFIFSQNSIVGLDIDSKALQKAAKQSVYRRLVQHRGNKIPVANNSFDTIISNCVLEHLPHPESDLKEIYRLLKPGGYFFLTVMTNKWDNYVILPKKWWQKVQKHYSLYSVQAWKKLFSRAGFRIKKTTAYLTKTQSRYIEILHFASFPYLLAEKFGGGWSKAGFIYRQITPLNKLTAIFSQTATIQSGAGAFFVLQK